MGSRRDVENGDAVAFGNEVYGDNPGKSRGVAGEGICRDRCQSLTYRMFKVQKTYCQQAKTHDDHDAQSELRTKELLQGCQIVIMVVAVVRAL